MNFEDLKNPEIQEKLRAAKTPEELLTLAKEEGLEMSDEEFQAISGGIKWRCSDKTCSGFSGCPADF